MKVVFYFILLDMIFLSSCTSPKASITPSISHTISLQSTNSLQSTTQIVSSPSKTITTTITNINEVLPFSLYYLYLDNKSGYHQIHKLDKQEIIETQLTNEPKGVSFFKVSPRDGRIIYLSTKNLILTDQNGNNQQMIAQEVHNMNWSHVGDTFAYWDKSLKIFSIDENKVIDSIEIGNYGSIFSNLEYSPDGLKIAIQTEKNTFKIIILKTKEIITLSQPEYDEKVSSSSTFTWSMDSKILYLWESVDAGSANGIIWHGLWRFNNEGIGYSLFTKGEYGYPTEITAAPWQDNNKNLFYLLLNGTLDLHNYPFNLVRTNMDAKTNRSIIRPESFYLYCNWPRPKWVSDGSGIIIPESKSCRIERLLFVPIDSTKPVTTLISDASGIFDFNLGP
jgi:hypothetical protein